MQSPITEVQPGSFIFAKEQALPVDVCNEIVTRFETSEEDQYPGRVGQTAAEESDIKRSTDLLVSGNPRWEDIDKALFGSLSKAMYEFKQSFPYFSGSFKDMGYAVQRTCPGEYYHWHIDGGSHEFSYRQLVAIWYLNSVEGPGGETEFRFQNLSIQPEIGKLILFPPFWTHEHRGAILHAGKKYIATTWVVFA